MKKGIDHIGVGVLFLCHDGRGNYLLARRTNKCRDEHGKWDPGAGGVNFKESILKALEREIKEEYCVKPKKIESLGFRDVHRSDERRRKTHWLVLDFKVLVDRKKVKNGDPKKHDMIGWFKLKDLPSPLHSQFPYFLKKYKSNL